MKNSNPFHSLYITEKISPKEYVGVVSPILVPHVNKLFMAGNVVIQGTQGSGKTTLLALLKPEIREAYLSTEEPFPLQSSLSDFISPGINFLKSGILEFGKRPIYGNINEEESLFPLLFSDFFNYYICLDLFKTIEYIYKKAENYSNIKFEKTLFEGFITQIKKEDCWFGYLDDVNSYSDFIEKISLRKIAYRKFHQFNINALPEEILRTKTSIGEPISRTVRILKETGIISSNTNIFIRVDQIETIIESDEIRSSLGEKYRRMLNSALVKRDPYISYKIGSRTYAWKKELRTYNSSEKLEESRSYSLIDVDEMLRRKENRSTYIFPKFAKDVFLRRLKYFSIVPNDSTDRVFERIFGSSLENERAGIHYCKNSAADKALKKNMLFPSMKRREKEMWALLQRIYNDNPLEAILARSWLAQGVGKNNYENFDANSYIRMQAPWNNKKYWRKERTRLALMQLASNCNQSLVWGGAEEILNLGAAGILCFLSICQHVWDAHLRSLDPEDFSNPEGDKPLESRVSPTRISIDVQNLGINSASRQWVNKISELPGGDERLRVVENMGRWFRHKLLDDIKMSYPGHTGFSLELEVLSKCPEVEKFLRDATDYGVLYEVSHTSKTSKDTNRVKWYFNPIYCPCLKIYEARIKEPLYEKPSFVLDFIEGKKVEISKKVTSHPIQLKLFGE